MVNKFFWMGAALAAGMSCAMASVDVNVSDEAALDSVTGIGAAKAQAIVKEREANGPYKDEEDLASRIDGLGPRSIERLKANGLVIGGGDRGGHAVPTAAGSTAASDAPKGAVKLPAPQTQTAKK